MNAPTAAVAFKLDNARFPSRQIFELDFAFHDSGSSWARRPSSFQREGWTESARRRTDRNFCPWFAARAAAIAAASRPPCRLSLRTMETQRSLAAKQFVEPLRMNFAAQKIGFGKNAAEEPSVGS